MALGVVSLFHCMLFFRSASGRGWVTVVGATTWGHVEVLLLSRESDDAALPRECPLDYHGKQNTDFAQPGL